jgi:adenylate kinase family enzyme
MYEISSKTLEVISLALHDLCNMQLHGPDALRELASRVRFHGSRSPKYPRNEEEVPRVDSTEHHENDHSLNQVSPPHTQRSAKDHVSDVPVVASMDQTVELTVNTSADKLQIIFVLGGPGCGKGTICKRIIDDFGFGHLSVGDVLRAEVASGSELGQEVQQIMKDGLLVSDEVALRVIRDAINRACLSGSKILLDGFPRTVEQAIAFESSVCTPSKVLWLTCDDSILVSRIMARGQASGREDDNAETAAMRLRTFNENTFKIRDYYESKDASIFKVVDSSRTVEEVYEEAKTALEL